MTFSDGPWNGFYVYAGDGRRHWMTLHLSFRDGGVSGTGDDDVGSFAIKGRYDDASLEIHWTKTYLGRHSVYYKGYAEPARIWGTWELPGLAGGFTIWPGTGSASIKTVAYESVDLPSAVGAR